MQDTCGDEDDKGPHPAESLAHVGKNPQTSEGRRRESLVLHGSRPESVGRRRARCQGAFWFLGKIGRWIVKTTLIVAGITAALALAAAPQALADPFDLKPLDRSTLLTFTAPVALPTVTLPAGTYLFRFVDAANLGPTVLQVMDKDGKVAYAMLHTRPIVRTNAKNESEIVFKEAKENAPTRIGAWYFGENEGCELTYDDIK